MFYVLIFSILAVVLIVGGLATWRRSRREYERDEVEHSTQSTHAVVGSVVVSMRASAFVL